MIEDEPARAAREAFEAAVLERTRLINAALTGLPGLPADSATAVALMYLSAGVSVHLPHVTQDDYLAQAAECWDIAKSGGITRGGDA